MVQIKAKDGESIACKGFLYHASDGRWILSERPNLKTCCVGTLAHNKSQVTLIGDFSEYSCNRLLQIRGIVHHLSDGGCALSQVEIQAKTFPVWTALTVIALLVLCVAKLKRLLLP